MRQGESGKVKTLSWGPVLPGVLCLLLSTPLSQNWTQISWVCCRRNPLASSLYRQQLCLYKIANMTPSVAGVWVMLSRPRDPHDESRRSILLTFIFSSAASTEASLKNGDDNHCKGSCKAVLLNDALCHVWEPVFCTPRKLAPRPWAGMAGWGAYRWYPMISMSWFAICQLFTVWRMANRNNIFGSGSFQGTHDTGQWQWAKAPGQLWDHKGYKRCNMLTCCVAKLWCSAGRSVQ